MEHPNDTESINENKPAIEPEPIPETPAEAEGEGAAAVLEPKRPAHHVWRAAIAAGAMLFVWLVLMIVRFAGGAEALVPSLSAMYALRDILFGIGLYLAIARGVKAKVLSAAVFLAALVMIAISRNVYLSVSQGQPITIQAILGSAQSVILQIMVMVSFAVLFGYALRKNPDTVSFTQTVWFSVGVLLVYYAVNVFTGSMEGVETLVTSMTNNVIRVCVIAFSAILMRRLCVAETLALEQSLLRRIWCVIGAAGAGTYLALQILHPEPYLVLYALAAAAFIGFLLLLFGRKEGFYAVLFASLIFAIHTLEEALYYMMLGFKEPWPILATSAVALAIPALAWFLVLRAPEPKAVRIEAGEPAQTGDIVSHEAAQSEPEPDDAP